MQTYTVEVLREMKKTHEEKIPKLTELQKNPSTLDNKIIDVPIITGKGRLIDRNELIEEVFEKLRNNYGLPIYLVTGGGMGKSFFSNALCLNEKYTDYFDAIFFIRAGSEEVDIRIDLMNEMGNNDKNADAFFTIEPTTIEQNWRRFIELRKVLGKVLIVIVDVNSIEKIMTVEEYLPDLRCHSLVTSSKLDISDHIFDKIFIDGRFIEFRKLDINFCVDLFLQEFCNGRKLKEIDCKNQYMNEIKRIVTSLNLHNILIIIAAKTGNKLGYTEPCDLIKLCAKIETREIDAPIEWLKFFIKEVNLKKESINTMLAMSFLLSQPIPQSVLENWLKNITPHFDEIIESLCLLGWIEMSKMDNPQNDDKVKYFSFHVHYLVQDAFLQLYEGMLEQVFEQLISNLANFLYLPILGGDCSLVTPYLEHIKHIITKYKHNRSFSMYRLIKNYVFVLLRAEMDPDVLSISKELKEEFDSYHIDTNNKSTEWLEVYFLFDIAHSRYEKDKNRFIQRQNMCAEMLEFAKKIFEKTDYYYVRAEFNSIRANAYSENDDHSRIVNAIKQLSELAENIERYYVQNEKSSEIKYVLFEINKAILDYYKRLFLVEINFNNKKKYIDEADNTYKIVEGMLPLIGDHDDYKRKIQNILGEYLINKYEIYKDSSFVEKALDYIENSYRESEKKYGSLSMAASKALLKKSQAYRQKEDFDNAIRVVKQALQTFITIFGDKKHKLIWKSYWELGKIYNDKHLITGSASTKDEAKQNFLEAISIAESFTDAPGIYHIEYQALLNDYNKIICKEI